MAKYRILWVDDEWADNAENLCNAKTRLLSELADKRIDVSIKTESTIADAVVEVSRQDIEYRLVVVDLVFHEQRYEVEPLLGRLYERMIPYIVFTNFIDKLDDKRFGHNKKNYFVGKFVKSPQGCIDFSKAVALFFSSLPVRILHLSDLHYDANLSIEVDKEERDALFDSLVDCIENESNIQPFDAVVICGDISMFTPNKDLIEARSLIKRINTVTVNDLNRLAIIPGNHDILWDDFDKKKLSEQPMRPYLEFYHAIYGQHVNILCELSSWNNKYELFDHDSTTDKLSWVRNIPSSRLNLIGLCSINLDPEKQGHGIFSRQQKKIIEENWHDDNKYNVRIALMHHNLYAALSFNRNSETSVLDNSGEAMYSLMSNGCTCVLSGHTHSVNYVQCKASRLGLDGFTRLTSFDVISGGTAGGTHIVRDRPRSFNIINFSHIKADTMKRTMTISPFLYDSDEHKWKEKRPLECEGG
ncbi:MAG: metallophosphoesterase [Desulfosarcina sp.]|nr:metallophosphoesterase [Desulfobacterales bacterium]